MKSRLTFPHPLTNQGKLQQLDNLHHEYVQYVRECVLKMVVDHRVNVFPSERKTYFGRPAHLTVHIAQSAQIQAVSLVTTWVAGLYGRVLRKHIQKQGLPELETIQLYTIGKYKLTHGGTFGRAVVPQHLVDLYWSWVWDPSVVGNPPVVGPRTPMRLTEMTTTFGENKDSTHFKGWWLRFSSLTRRKTVEIPLKSSPYLRKHTGFALTVYVQRTVDGLWAFRFTEKGADEKEPTFDGSAGKIGVDVGLNVLAATSNGDLYGQTFKSKFDKLRKKVLEVRANRQRQGIKTDSKRLWKLERRLSGQIKTATGTVANQLVERHPHHTFVVEDLDLSGCKGSKRFAYRALHSALSRKAAVEVVNPAYSSQTCPSCGYVSRGNRNGVVFQCRSCGRKGHADFVGGLNLLRRSEDKQIRLDTPVKSVRGMLRGRYLARRRAGSSSSGFLVRGAPSLSPGFTVGGLGFPGTRKALKLVKA